MCAHVLSHESTPIAGRTYTAAKGGGRERVRSTDKVVGVRNKRMFGILNATLKTAAAKTDTQQKAVRVTHNATLAFCTALCRDN